MISLLVIMCYELSNCLAQGVLAEEYQAVQARFFDGSHKTLRMCIQIRGLRRKLHALYAHTFQNVLELRSEQRIAIVDQKVLAV